MIFSFQSNKILSVTTINNVGTRSGKSSIFAENSDESVRVLHQIRRGKTRSLKIHLREQTNYTKAYQLRWGGFLYFMQHDCTMKGRCWRSLQEAFFLSETELAYTDKNTFMGVIKNGLGPSENQGRDAIIAAHSFEQSVTENEVIFRTEWNYLE